MDILTDAFPQVPPMAFPFLIIWTVVLKGFALWRSSRKSQKYWFIVMLIVNLFGLIELVYLLFFSDGFIQELLGQKKPTTAKKKRTK